MYPVAGVSDAATVMRRAITVRYSKAVDVMIAVGNIWFDLMTVEVGLFVLKLSLSER